MAQKRLRPCAGTECDMPRCQSVHEEAKDRWKVIELP